MEKKNKKITKKGKSREEIREEIKKFVEETDNIAQKQLDLFSKEEDASFDVSSIKLNAADPEASYRLYYTIQKILKQNLPTGKANKKLRDYILEEKTIFLNRGKKKDSKGIRGSDSRMTYIDPFLEEALQIIISWLSSGANPLDLYDLFNKKNKEYGFYNEE